MEFSDVPRDLLEEHRAVTRDVTHWLPEEGRQETRIVRAKSPQAGGLSRMPIVTDDPDDPEDLKRNPRVTAI